MEKRWYTIRLHDGARHQFRGFEMLRTRSKKAEIIISRLECLGMTMFHNRLERLSSGSEENEICELMHSEKEGYAYNELVVHLPLHALEQPRRVMIMGGGTLYTAREVLKHPSVEHVDVVDYDSDVTDITIQHYDPSLQTIRNDPRVHMHCADVREFLLRTPNGEYDVVIDDLIDLIRVEDRWVLELFPKISDALKESGLFSTYLYPSWYHEELNRLIIKKLIEAGFGKIMTTAEDIFTYSWPEGFTSFVCAARKWEKTLGETNHLLRKHFRERNTSTLQFHPELHPLHEWGEHPNAAK